MQERSRQRSHVDQLQLREWCGSTGVVVFAEPEQVHRKLEPQHRGGEQGQPESRQLLHAPGLNPRPPDRGE